MCTSKDDLYYWKKLLEPHLPEELPDKEQDWGKYYQAENLISMIGFDSCSGPACPVSPPPTRGCARAHAGRRSGESENVPRISDKYETKRETTGR